ncbi:hypothetical protein [Arthrobacter bambusae]|uniref:hypothetical protein n=1 Tax=Arthrobacter bambusae TaxID=1338426 RepID=UPI00277F17EA|nr:hypothetical protein [Arthrobacter bambusae]MDQ0241460.1 hypothetical protein [Arthrobacter bambusae]
MSSWSEDGSSPIPAVAPAQAWVLAPLIAGQDRMRLGRWEGGRFKYPGRTPARITGTVPKQPAAVLVHGLDGAVATLCLDLDTSKAEQSVVDADAVRLGELLTGCGLRYVADSSPSGGRHLYVPLAERLDGAAARELVEALGYRAVSLDPGPHQNIASGCIRVPGSVHKRGGHQTLTTALAEAYDILKRRNPAAALDRLRAALAPELLRLRKDKTRAEKAATTVDTAGLEDSPGPGRHSRSPLAATARSGLYDTSLYAGRSEARQAVLAHLAATGWSLQHVRHELRGTELAGLAALYHGKEGRLLDPEWDKALAYAQNLPQKAGGNRGRTNHPRNSDTSPPLTRRGGASGSKAAVRELVNDLENFLHVSLDPKLARLGREGHSLRLLMRSLLGYMRAEETQLLELGCRSLAVSLGKHHGTTAALLARLVELSDGILSKIEDAKGTKADLYLIELPDKYRAAVKDLSWRRGKIYGIRPVFRALGDIAALVYEAIERARFSPITAEIIRASGCGDTAVAQALRDMAALGMIHRAGDDTWHITATTNLTELAKRLGVYEDYLDHIARNRVDRTKWHARLSRHAPEQRVAEVDMYDAERDEWWLPPPDADPASWQQQLYQAA